MSDNEIRSVGELLSAVPVLVGFVPERSLVLMEVRPGGRVGAVARTDLRVQASGEVTRRSVVYAQESMRLLAQACDDFDFSDLVAVVVFDGEVDQQVLARQVRSMLDGHAVESVVFTASVLAGAPWWCECCGQTGTVADYRTVPGLARYVAERGAPLSSRETMVSMLTPCTVVVPMELVEAARVARGPQGTAQAGRALIEAARASDGPGVLSDQQVAQFGAALMDPNVRDVFLGAVFTSWADQARELARHVATRVTGEARAAALTTYAAFAYTGGDGPMTGIALDAALAERGGMRLTHLLAKAFSAGVPPQVVRELLAESSLAHAAKVGVTLPGVDPAMDPSADAQVAAGGLA